MADTSYVVKSLGAYINCDNGQTVWVLKGGPVPSNVKPEHLQHLIDNDLVEEGEVAGGLEPVLAGDGKDLPAPKPGPAPKAAKDAPADSGQDAAKADG